MGSNLFTSALSAMNAAQAGMAATQHNIANAATPGFSRQEVGISSRAGQQSGSGFIGSGVDVAGVTRVYDQYLVNQVRLEQTQSSYLSAYHSAMTQIDNLIADPTAGASPAIQEFFSALNGVANSPESIPARQTLIGTAQFVVNRFQAINQRLSDIADGLNGQVTHSVNMVNNYAQQIAALNGNIKRAIASGQGQPPNDLLDQRDQVINQLNKEIKVSVQMQQDGALNVYVGNGQTLVIDETAMRLDTVRSANDPSRVDIVYRDGNITTPLQQSGLQGGNLGAYLSFRDQSLEPARNALGRVALGLADSMNKQNRSGLDLTGAVGGDIFGVAAPRVEQGVNNIGNGRLSAVISDVTQLTTSDYQLRYDGSTYMMARLSDNTLTSVGTAGSPPTDVTIDGFTITLAGLPQKGDSFLIRPTADGARDIRVAIANPAGIAAAAPIRTAADITNSGTARISAGSVDGAFSADVFTPAVTLVYDSATNTLNGFPALPVTLTNNGVATTFAAGAPVPYTDGGTYSVGGASFTMTGKPSSGSFIGGSNAAAVAATDFSAAGAPLTSGRVSFTTTDFNFQSLAPGKSTAQPVGMFDFSGSSPAIDGKNVQATNGTINFSGARLAQFNVSDGVNSASITLTSVYANMDAVAAELQAQVRAGGGNLATVTVVNDAGTLTFANVGQTTALQVFNVDVNARLAGFAASPGVTGEVAGASANMTIDGVPISLNQANANITDVAAELTSKMQASALGSAYSAAVVNGAIEITNADSHNAVVITAADPKARVAGFSDSAGVAGVAASDPSTLVIDGHTVALNQNYGSFAGMRQGIADQLGGDYLVTNTGGAFRITRNDAGGASSQAINIVGDTAADMAGITSGGARTGVGGSDFVASTIVNFMVGATGVTLDRAYADRAAVRDALQAQLAGYVVTDNGVSYTFTSLTSPEAVAITNANPAAVAAGFADSPGVAGTLPSSGRSGDKFTLGVNTNATGDNRNALLMAGMQSRSMMANGTATFQDIYGQLVGEVGAKTHELYVTSQAQINMTAQTVAAQQSVSGVNLDEEAANLMRYQRAYQAAAKALQVANTMFDALLSLGR